MKGASRSAAGRGGGPGGPAAHSAHEPCGAQDKAVSTAAVTGVYRPKGNSGNNAITVTVASLKGVVASRPPRHAGIRARGSADVHGDHRAPAAVTGSVGDGVIWPGLGHVTPTDRPGPLTSLRASCDPTACLLPRRGSHGGRWRHTPPKHRARGHGSPTDTPPCARRPCPFTLSCAVNTTLLLIKNKAFTPYTTGH